MPVSPQDIIAVTSEHIAGYRVAPTLGEVYSYLIGESTAGSLG